MHRNDIVIWFDTPPKVSKGAFNYLASNWGKKVYYVCNKDYPEFRKLLNWNDGNFGRAEVVFLEGIEDKNSFVRLFIDKHQNSIHIVSGFNNGIEKLIRDTILKINAPLVFFSERPDNMGSIFERLIRRTYCYFKYRYFYQLYRKNLKAFLPLGMKGVNTFATYGYSHDIMMPFMYNPEAKLIDLALTQYKRTDEAIKFLYVGRFYFKTKGIDILMKAVSFLHGKWRLDLVGGYGKDADEVKEWAANTENVNFLGSWPSHEVSHRMSEYDVVIVPSKYDGWNLLVNEAINAGIGVIVSDQATSDEIIRFGKAGIVYRSNRPKELAKAMQVAIDNPNIVIEWSKNAISTAEFISPETVGTYLINILDYFVYGVGNRPVCPWLTQE